MCESAHASNVVPVEVSDEQRLDRGDPAPYDKSAIPIVIIKSCQVGDFPLFHIVLESYKITCKNQSSASALGFIYDEFPGLMNYVSLEDLSPKNRLSFPCLSLRI